MDEGAQLVPVQQEGIVVPAGAASLPAIILRSGRAASERFVDFFTAQIHNPNTREAYARAAGRFFQFVEIRFALGLAEIRPVHIAAYLQVLERELAAPSVKQHLAAIRMLFDYLVTGGLLPFNPAAAVRGPKHVVKKGKTPVLTAGQARTLLDAIKTDTIVGLRDRALIGVPAASVQKFTLRTPFLAFLE